MGEAGQPLAFRSVLKKLVNLAMELERSKILGALFNAVNLHTHSPFRIWQQIPADLGPDTTCFKAGIYSKCRAARVSSTSNRPVFVASGLFSRLINPPSLNLWGRGKQSDASLFSPGLPPFCSTVITIPPLRSHRLLAPQRLHIVAGPR